MDLYPDLDTLRSVLGEERLRLYAKWGLVKYPGFNITKYYFDIVKPFWWILLESGLNEVELIQLFKLGLLKPQGRDRNYLNGEDAYRSHLYEAIYYRKYTLAEYLITHGGIINDEGYSPLILAITMNLTDITLLLLENGARVKVQRKKDHYTPFRIAVENENETIVMALLDKEASPQIRRRHNVSLLKLILFSDKLLLRIMNEFSHLLTFDRDIENIELPLSTQKILSYYFPTYPRRFEFDVNTDMQYLSTKGRDRINTLFLMRQKEDNPMVLIPNELIFEIMKSMFK